LLGQHDQQADNKPEKETREETGDDSEIARDGQNRPAASNELRC
jgi:hypothetical protein